jgi:Kef-type K+ transport system membrane component KefB
MSTAVTLIVQVSIIVLVARVFGRLFRLVGQPQVIGEMVAGILLGPTLLGAAAPRVFTVIFPPASLNYLNALSQIGILIYMFLVGLALNPKELKGTGHAAVLTSHMSIIAPFVLGSLLALLLYPRLSDDSVSFVAFALFMGAAMSITAFPVLARILTDRNMLASRLGTLAIACAAVDDVTGWCILAYIVVLVRAHSGSTPLWLTLAGAAVYALVMIYGVRLPLRQFLKIYRSKGQLSENLIAVLILLVLASSLITDRLGIHLLFGAFLFGAVMPKDRAFIRYILEKFESLTVVLLLPLYFAYTGLRMNLNSVHGRGMWFYCAAIVMVAITGKLLGSMTAARSSGVPWKEAVGLGILMNTRGLMELVILNIGLDVGVISPVLFSMMVLMALVTTFMTTPLLEWIYPLRLIREEIKDAPVVEQAVL